MSKLDAFIQEKQQRSEEWKAQKTAERDELNAWADNAILATTMDPNAYLHYLDVQADNPRYSASNVLLAMEQNPEITYINSLKGWNELGRSIKRDEIGLKVRVSEPYVKDGRQHRGYRIGRVFDISQTTGKGSAPKLTVRENTYLRGAMLGYTRKFMDERYPEIIAFAELQGFEDTAFKRLSSGMKSRLAFSIASLVDPDILILDEVLAVGDGAFRKKSEEKMRQIMSNGTTTILVSHSLQQVRTLCNKVLWLHKGKQIDFGETNLICDRYQQMLDGKLTL